MNTKSTPAQVKTRFAPSPTGLMHFGNLRTALFNYLFAKNQGGSFLLRVEDTDVARSEDVYRDSILKDLQWLDLEWQEGPFYQSQRQDIYNQYYQQLEKEGKVYPCFCSEEQLELTRKIQIASGQPPRYSGTCLKLSDKEIEHKKSNNQPYTLRFRVPKGETIQFEDQIKGLQRFDLDHIGDFIIRRADGSSSFMFCNAIDDALMGITHALRGDDHLTNTPRQILILKTLGLPFPLYGHFPTILGPDSRPLSKRNGSRSIHELKEEGYLPLTILNYLARLGHFIPSEIQLIDLNELGKNFSLKAISLSPAHYDSHQLDHWQKEAMHHSDLFDCLQVLKPYIEHSVPQSKMELFVQTIQQNIVMPKEAEFWAEAIFSDAEDLSIPPEIKEVFVNTGSEFFMVAFELLKEENIENLEFKTFLDKLQQKTGKKGKALFFPLRAALTRALHGPELARVLDLIGLEKARHRLLRASDYASHL